VCVPFDVRVCVCVCVCAVFVSASAVLWQGSWGSPSVVLSRLVIHAADARQRTQPYFCTNI